MTAGPRAPLAADGALYEAHVRHVRTGGHRYALRHRTFLWLVDLDALPRLPGPLRVLAGFDARDHFGGRLPRSGPAWTASSRRAGPLCRRGRGC